MTNSPLILTIDLWLDLDPTGIVVKLHQISNGTWSGECFTLHRRALGCLTGSADTEFLTWTRVNIRAFSDLLTQIKSQPHRSGSGLE